VFRARTTPSWPLTPAPTPALFFSSSSEVPVTTAEAGRPQRASTAARLQFALGSFVVSALLTAIGTFQGDDDHAWRNWLIVLAISAAVTAIVFWVVVPRIDNLARGALILAVV